MDAQALVHLTDEDLLLLDDPEPNADEDEPMLVLEASESDTHFDEDRQKAKDDQLMKDLDSIIGDSSPTGLEIPRTKIVG